MPMTMDEYEYLREAMEQVQGLADLAGVEAKLADIRTEVTDNSQQEYSALSVLLKAMNRACDDVVAVAEGMVEVPEAS